MNIKPDQAGFDFDGVIADIGEAFLRLACNDHGYCSIDLSEISSFQVEDCINIPRQVVEKIFNDILMDSIGTGLKPIGGAIETLSRLSRHSDIIVITARKEIGPVADWFDHFLAPDCRSRLELVATGDHDNKEAYIRQRGLSHFFDDRAKTCVQLAEAGLTPIVFSQPWNRNQHNLASVADWQELESLFDFTC